MIQLPATKTEAVRIGAKFYQGKAACPRRHADMTRYTRGGRCVTCTREDAAARMGRTLKASPRGLIRPERAKAVTNGETTYQGTACPKGHTERFTTSNNCVECSRAAIERDAENRKWSRRLRLYGLTRGEFEALKAAQAALCPICVTDLPSNERIHVDHCHATGRVRGLLCGPCNQAIGLFKEDASRMGRAIVYVRS